MKGPQTVMHRWYWVNRPRQPAAAPLLSEPSATHTARTQWPWVLIATLMRLILLPLGTEHILMARQREPLPWAAEPMYRDHMERPWVDIRRHWAIPRRPWAITAMATEIIPLPWAITAHPGALIRWLRETALTPAASTASDWAPTS